MFGFRGGESDGTFARKKGYMREAQKPWGFLTYFDLSTIKNEVQCLRLHHSGQAPFRAWMQGKQF